MILENNVIDIACGEIFHSIFALYFNLYSLER